MEHQMKLTIDYTRKAGTVRRLNGVNLAPPPIAEKASRDLSADFAALRAPYARLHDAPLENGNMRLVDVPFLFGNCDADAADKANYYFRQTDDYLATCRRCGSDIIYRLGVSIEHGIGRYYAFPPEDFEKWSDICVNIVRHYNEGWNDGFAWNIRYWEIWNEPDLAGNMWNAPLERYFELYALTAKKLKARFPGIKVGGPAYACCDPGRINAFLDACRAADAPLDFFSWHCYTADPAEIAAQPAPGARPARREGLHRHRAAPERMALLQRRLEKTPQRRPLLPGGSYRSGRHQRHRCGRPSPSPSSPAGRIRRSTSATIIRPP